ncbi:hypothetical protein [Undibacterium sp.]|uniref:hypothetical protein n=1 Tax=Undibacterium sp. TaxID=1914977 RepID=UPI0037500B50
MTSFISIGAQLGGPEPCLIAELKVGLFHALSKHLTSTQCKEIDEYAIVLRVDGALHKFGKEGLARMRLAKTQRYITIDVQIPETVWHPLNKTQTKIYLTNQVRSAISMCVARLIKEKYVVVEECLWAQINAAFNEYLADESSDK